MEEEEKERDGNGELEDVTARPHGLGSIALSFHYKTGKVVHHIPNDLAARAAKVIRLAY